MSNNLSQHKKRSRLRKRRGVADVISTMMLMAVTVTGASTLTYFVNDAFVSGNLGSVSTLDSSSLNVLLLAYDSRDSSSLLTITDLNNENNSFLCGVTCSITPNTIPADGGTEFIVIQIQNNGLDSIFLKNIAVNNVNHSWDSDTSGIKLETTVSAPLSGKYPADGTFSILPVSVPPIFQSENTEIQSGQKVNILVKLGPDDSDIQLNKGIQLLFNTGGIHPVEFLILSGDAR